MNLEEGNINKADSIDILDFTKYSTDELYFSKNDRHMKEQLQKCRNIENIEKFDGVANVTYTMDDGKRLLIKYNILDLSQCKSELNEFVRFDLSFSYVENFQKYFQKFDRKNLMRLDFYCKYSVFTGHFNFWYFNSDETNIDFENTFFINSFISFGKLKLGEGRINFTNSKHISYGKIVAEGLNKNICEIYFNEQNLENTTLICNGMEGKSVTFSRSSLKTKADLRFNYLDKISFEDSYIEGDVFLNGNAEYNYLSLDNTINTGRIYINWFKNNVEYATEAYINKCYENKEEKLKSRIEQYRILKNSFNAVGYYTDEDKALVKFMDNYLISQRKHPLLIFNLIGEYGTNPVSIFITAIFTIMLFALGYCKAGLDLSKLGFLENNIWGNIYFSSITFLTIGYGDISPNNERVMILSAIEGFFGVFLMSYFSVAVVRKILR